MIKVKTSHPTMSKQHFTEQLNPLRMCCHSAVALNQNYDIQVQLFEKPKTESQENGGQPHFMYDEQFYHSATIERKKLLQDARFFGALAPSAHTRAIIQC